MHIQLRERKNGHSQENLEIPKICARFGAIASKNHKARFPFWGIALAIDRSVSRGWILNNLHPTYHLGGNAFLGGALSI